MSIKHTPAPWEAHTGEDYTVVMLPDECTDNASIAVYGSNDEANARLIAAAPELLEALKKAEEAIREIAEENDGDYELADELRAVIAKATGEAP